MKCIAWLAAAVLIMTLMGPSTPGSTAKSVTLGVSPSYAACIDAAQGMTHNLENCASIEQDRLDRHLSTVMATAAENAGPDERRRLAQFHSRWLRARQSECIARVSGQSDLAGPLDEPMEFEDFRTLELLMVRGCVIDATIKRIRWLRHGNETTDH